MSAEIRVVHVSASPLVGAPLKIATLMRSAGIYSSAFCEHDYPNNGPLFGKFSNGSVVLSDTAVDGKGLFADELAKATVVHVHNSIAPETICQILRFAPRAKLVYHVHSPIKEGPQYIDRAEELGLEFDRRLVVAQYQPRMYPDFEPVPNVVLDAPSINLRGDDEPLRLCFSPTHARGGRWNAKTNDVFETALKSISSMKRVAIYSPKSPMAPSSLLAMRRLCHASIDEVVTGAFHQVTLESLVCGNVAINGADHFAKASFADCFGCDASEVPFVSTHASDLVDLIDELAKSPDLTRQRQQSAHAFAVRYMAADHMSSIFRGVYESLF